jgi:hypothetical protein
MIPKMDDTDASCCLCDRSGGNLLNMQVVELHGPVDHCEVVLPFVGVEISICNEAAQSLRQHSDRSCLV